MSFNTLVIQLNNILAEDDNANYSYISLPFKYWDIKNAGP